MTRSKIQKMKFFVFLFIFLLAQIAICDENSVKKENPSDAVSSNKQNVAKDSPEIHTNPLQPNKVVNLQNSRSNITAEKSETNGNLTKNDTKIKQPTEQPEEEHGLNSAALRRGFYVFLCLGALVIAYIMFRTFRINKSRTQMVRKYGVLTHRQDVEMRPLPLDEDDEDDTTIFDARNIPVHGQKEQQPTTA